PMKYVVMVCGGGLVVGIPLMMSAGYRSRRLFGFLHRSSDALGTGYQSMQGLVGLGKGHLLGVGLGNGIQKWGFLPNPHTDFMFANIGEETGLVGTLVVLSLYAVLAVLGIRASKRARDPFGFLIAAGMTAWISLQVLINLGAVTGLLPITGVPLPLLSFGGT